MSIPNYDTAKYVWQWFRANTDITKIGVAALMGNMRAESSFIPNNMQDAYETARGYTDATYTSIVDSGTYRWKNFTTCVDSFAHDEVGYGLCQWTFYSRKSRLYEFAKADGVSIGNLQMQCKFAWDELQKEYVYVLNKIRNATDLRAASDVILKQFENPQIQTEPVQIERAGYGQEIYEAFHDLEDTPAVVADAAGSAEVEYCSDDDTPTEAEIRRVFLWAYKKHGGQI